MGKYDCLRLETQLCFPLYVCSKEIIRKYKPYLDPLGLTYTQYIAMMVMWERKKVNVKELGERLYLDSGTLTPLLKKMEEKGLVRRERSSKDERVLDVVIDINRCFISPLIRCFETALVLVGDRVEIVRDDRLIQREMGELTGRDVVEYNAYQFWDYDKNRSDYGVVDTPTSVFK